MADPGGADGAVRSVDASGDHGPPLRRGRRAARGRENVLAGVRRVLARRGADATRFSDVIAETGTALSSLQYRFGNREDLIIAAMRNTNASEVARVKAAMQGAGDPPALLRLFVRETIRVGVPVPEAREGWLVWVEYWRAAARDPDLAVEWQAAYKQWRDLLRPILEAGLERGDFRPPADIEAVITLTLALFDGLSIPMVLEQADVEPDRAAELTLATLASLLGAPALLAAD
jgi:AcrR family transcriptional regulator